MRLDYIKVKAKEITEESLIYLPKEKRFFWVDFIDYNNDGTIDFIFEELPLRDIRITFKPNQIVINIKNDLLLTLNDNE